MPPGTPGSRRGWLGWLEDHRPAVGGIALWVALALIVGAAVATGGAAAFGRATGVHPSVAPTDEQGPSPSAAATKAGQPAKASPKAAKGKKQGGPASPTPGATSPGPGGPGGGGPGTGSPPPVPGTKPLPPCTPGSSNETGVTKGEVKLGQIVTDSSTLPGQFRPAYEGLMAYAKLVNDGGGICGRRLSVEFQNDNSNPLTHDYRSMAQRVFAFVANESLLDGEDYQTSPPFNPRYTDNRTGGYVPDVGGLAFAYGRSQSAWHAGVVGSVSPVLIGGGQFRYFVDEARASGRPCRKAGVVYLVEPTGASKDQGLLFQAALEAPWGANLGPGSVHLYQAALLSPVLVYKGLVQNMVRDGVNCVFTASDLASNINLAKAMAQEGVWPPDTCSRGDECFSVFWIPFSAYDPEFIRDAGSGARFVSSFLPHLPLNETGNPAMRSYLDALTALARSDSRFGGAEPSTFSLLGFASGIMFGEALAACGGSPTRNCVMSYLRSMQSFTAGGLLGRITPFRTTRVNYGTYGTFDWKWIFADSVAVRVLGNEATLIHRFHRVNPPGGGFFPDTLHVARGSPA